MNKKVIDNFTPGPWAIIRHATPEHSPQYGIYTEDASGWDIATVHGENAAANAALIAAAPELLACILDVLNADGDLYVMDFDRYRAAIANLAE